MSYDGYLKFNTKIDSSGFSSGIHKIGSIAKSGLAVISGLTAGIIASFAATSKASLDSVASLEQNLGGIETLFKDSADIVIENAKRAYKTAGMSANEYMQNVTSFSASLLQSLSGNTKAAAEVADMAMTDMSDNANKMGTSMELIQNAYQGFAKQNYTMLDNLKLGYGGTKTEMERLLADAQKLTGVKYDINNLSDVYNAIHAIQNSLGITGTTAKEAASTIEGSMNSAKAAWDNFLNGTISAEDFADTISIAAENITKNLGEIVPRLASTIPELGRNIYEMIVSSFDQNGVGIAQAGIGLINNLASGLSEAAPKVTGSAGKIVSDLMTGIQNAAPQMLSSAADLIASFAQGIGEQLPTLIPQAMNMIVTLADAVIANIPKIVQAGVSILVGLVSGIINGLPTLIEEGPRIINEFADAIYNGIGTLLGTGLAMIVELGKGIINNIPLIIQNAGEILKAIINVFSLSSMLNLGKKLIESLAKGMKAVGPAIKAALSNIGKTGLEAIKNLKWSQVGKAIITFISTSLRSGASMAVNALKSVGTLAMNAFKSISWGTVGKAVITGIANGITGAAGAIVTAAKNAAKKALDAAKNFLGIHSPSTVFRDQVGKNMALGMGLGFEKNVPISEISKSLDNAVDDIQSKTLRVRLNSITRSLNESATNRIRAGKTVDDDRSRERQNEDKDPIDYKRLGREMGKRPIYVSAKLNDREVVKMTAKPMKEQMDNDEKIRKMLKGEPVWA
ncbi:phage tail protein [Coprococcus catus]